MGCVRFVGHQAWMEFGQSNIVKCRNYKDEDGNPAGGYAHGPGMSIVFQDGPRGKNDDGTLLPANGAFVEDVLVAALQRLEFFQNSRFAHPANAEAIKHILAAIEHLDRRANERSARGVLGENKV